jgi:pimeloyl-ACP methyl ester carboxylesterase
MRFLLVHGPFHGAWCWDHTIAALARLGHDAVAVEMPGHAAGGDNSTTLAERRDAIVALMEPGDVLVGHSSGGYDICIAADAAPERAGHLVFLAAGLPSEGQRLISKRAVVAESTAESDGPMLSMPKDLDDLHCFMAPLPDGRVALEGFEGAYQYLYHDCDEATARSAYARLTPMASSYMLETVSLPRLWTAQPPRSYIACRDDRVESRGKTQAVAARLGVEPLIIDGSHAPFISRPATLAATLVEAVNTRPNGPLLPQ